MKNKFLSLIALTTLLTLGACKKTSSSLASAPLSPTPDVSTPAPSTPTPSEPVASTPAASTPAPSTPNPSTPAPSTPSPSTPAPSSSSAAVQIVVTASATEVNVNETITLSASVENVTWKVSDATLASITTDGVLTGLKAGTVVVTAEKSGCIAGTISITVKEAQQQQQGDFIIEFEDATHYSPSGTWGGGWGSDPYPTPVIEDENSHNGKYLGNMAQGCKETLTFTASKDATVDLGFVMAATAMNFTTWSSIDDVTIADVMTIKVNGNPLNLAGKVLPGSDTLNWTNFQEIKITGVSLNAGDNTIEVEITGGQGPNLDYVKIYSSGVTYTVKKGAAPAAVDYEEKGTYTYFVDGYEWGPGVKVVMVDFGSDSVSATDLSKDLFDVSSTGNQGAKREVTDVYLCDENGNKISATTGTRIAIEMKLDIKYTSYGSFGFNSYNGCDPFSYDQSTSLNSWAADYGYSIKQKTGTTLKVGTKEYKESTLLTTTTASANPKVIRATKNWTAAKTYTKDNKTLAYKAFETDELKNDGAKNPLIIWLHGQGEGGTDPDIALLGNDVTNLGESKIQSYFKKTGAEQGAYVLAPQSPTMWMDNGSGQNNQGNAKSIYTTALKGLIDQYVQDNADIDSNRIYIGGCSNGGYMTMNMVLEYPSFFAAAYPICEAYSDSFITANEINSIKNVPLWFVASADDTTVKPDNFVKPTYKRLKDAGNSDVHFSFFEHVYGEDTGSQVQYMGHWSWIYAFEDKVNKDQADSANISAPSTQSVTYGGKSVGLWDWLAAHSLSD